MKNTQVEDRNRDNKLYFCGQKDSRVILQLGRCKFHINDGFIGNGCSFIFLIVEFLLQIF